MTHLTDAELRHWLDRGAEADRERVLAHLAGCDPCRQSLSLMTQEPPPVDQGSTLVQPREVVRQGYAAYASPGRTFAWAGWLRPAYGLALVAALAFAGALILRPASVEPDETVRGSAPQVVGPSGRVRTLEAFTWSSPIDAPRYRVVVLDARGQVAFTGETA